MFNGHFWKRIIVFGGGIPLEVITICVSQCPGLKRTKKYTIYRHIPSHISGGRVTQHREEFLS